MSTLLVWKEQLQKLYAKYSTYIMMALQFILGLFVFGLINSNIGFMKAASSILCTVGLSVVCAFLPLVVMVIAATALVLLHFYTLSMPIALVTFIIFLVMYIFYFRFTPKKAWLVLLTPVAFALKVPFVIPVAFGLLATPICVLPVTFGTVIYYMIHFVKGTSSAYKGGDAKGLVEGVMAFTKQSMTNKEMWVMAAALAVSLLVVYAVRTRAVDHAWKIGFASGVVTAIVIGAVGNITLNVHLSYGSMILSGVAAIIVGLVLEFLFFSVNYSRTEHMQFEDDEYYYYVKAVPKIGVSAPEISVKHINERKEQQDSQETVVIDSQEIKHASDTEILSHSTQKSAQQRRPAAKQKNSVRKVEQVRKTDSVRRKEPVKKVDHARAADEILLTRSLTKELGLESLEDELNKE